MKVTTLHTLLIALMSAIVILFGCILVSPIVHVYTMNFMSQNLFLWGLAAVSACIVILPLAAWMIKHEDGLALLGNVKFKTWLTLHGLCAITLSIIYPFIVGLLIFFTIWHPPKLPNFLPFVLFYSLLLYFLYFPIFYYVLNIIGFGYTSMGTGSLLGICTFARLSSVFLRTKERSGVTYLLWALKMLKDHLKDKEKEMPKLNEAINAVGCIRDFKVSIPYDDLEPLSDGLTKLPNMRLLSDKLIQFMEKQSVSWTKSLVGTKRSRKQWLEIAVALAVIFTALFTFLPETRKEFMLEQLLMLGSSDSIMMILSICLLIVNFYLRNKIVLFSFNLFHIRKLSID